MTTTIRMSTKGTALVCGECAEGNYYRLGDIGPWHCTRCSHRVNVSDIAPNLDDGERLVMVLDTNIMHGVLAVTED